MPRSRGGEYPPVAGEDEDEQADDVMTTMQALRTLLHPFFPLPLSFVVD